MANSRNITPTEIGKHPRLIKAAQDELSQLDVLVCGRCLWVGHFSQELNLHKDSPKCERDASSVRDCPDNTPKTWAFLLWKQAQLQSCKDLEDTPANTWILYQNWIKLDDHIRATWIVAGKTIQSFSKIGEGNLTQMPVKITKTVISAGKFNNNVNKFSRNSMNNLRAGLKSETSAANANKTSENQKLIKKSTPLPTQQSELGNSAAPMHSNDSEISIYGKRTVPNSTEITEEIVEKIVAKRHNPRRKLHEYLVKWDGRPHDQNTWEPKSHLDMVPNVLETFEAQLRRQKETKAALMAKSNAEALKNGDISKTDGTSGLPKLPVLNRTNGGTKREHEDSKTIINKDSAAGRTIEDLEESLIPSHTVKRLKTGDAVSVEVKTKSEKNTEITKVNGASARSPNEKNSAEIVITPEGNSTGIIKKPVQQTKPATDNNAVIRVISKGEANTGIVRISGNNEATSTTNTGSDNKKIVISNRNTPTVSSGRPAGSAGASNFARKMSNTPQRTASGGSVQRKPTTLASAHPGRLASAQARNTMQQRPAQGTSANSGQSKNVTPEQKILQLSKSGDLKVTKKVMTREDLAAHKLQQARQQQARQHQQQQHQTQVNIQKVANSERQNQRTPNISIKSAGVKQSTESEQQQQQQQQQLAASISAEQQQQEEQLAQQQAAEQLVLQQQALGEMDGSLLLSNENQIYANEDGTPVFVTGEDGTIYQVAGKNADGQTILVTQGPDGEQQFAYVASTDAEESQSVLTLDSAVAEAVAQLPLEQQADALVAAAEATESGKYLVKTAKEDGTLHVVSMSEEELQQHQANVLAAAQQEGSIPATSQLCIATSDTDGEANIPAEVVQADAPSPGGTRRVVLMLQDGTFMMTEMHDDEYKALNIDVSNT